MSVSVATFEEESDYWMNVSSMIPNSVFQQNEEQIDNGKKSKKAKKREKRTLLKRKCVV